MPPFIHSFILLHPVANHVPLVFIQQNSKFAIKMIIGNIRIFVTFVMGQPGIIVSEITEKTILGTQVLSDVLLKEEEMLHLLKYVFEA